MHNFVFVFFLSHLFFCQQLFCTASGEGIFGGGATGNGGVNQHTKLEDNNCQRQTWIPTPHHITTARNIPHRTYFILAERNQPEIKKSFIVTFLFFNSKNKIHFIIQLFILIVIHFASSSSFNSSLSSYMLVHISIKQISPWKKCFMSKLKLFQF